MLPYLVLLGIITIQWIFLFPNWKINLNRPIEYKQKKYFCVLTCIDLIFFVGFRAMNIGADTETYISGLGYYRSLPHDAILSAKLVYPYDFEFGYFMLTKICAYVSMGNTVFLFLIAAIIYIPVMLFILRYSENPFISVLVYFAFGCFT